MSDMLAIGRSALLAYRGALTVVGDNVANVHTPGFVRRSADLRELSPVQGQPFGSGMGVRGAGVLRQWNQFIADSARSDSAAAAREQLRHSGAKQIEAALNDGETGVGQAMTGFFNAGRMLAADPASVVSQNQFRASLTGVTSALRQTAQALDEVATQNREQIDTALASANGRLAELAHVNARISLASRDSSEYAGLADSRDRILGALAQSLGAKATLDDVGRAKLTIDGVSQPLVNGAVAGKLVSTPSGALAVTSERGTEPFEEIGGEVGGLQATVDQARERRGDLDALAADFATAVNDWARGGRTSSGATGQALLAGSSAADITILPALADDLPLADASGVANGNLVALGNVRQNTRLERRWDEIVSGHAQFTANAQLVADASQLLADGSASRLDAATSVDLDAEAADLLRFQQAYQAAARVIKAADDAVAAVLQLL